MSVALAYETTVMSAGLAGATEKSEEVRRLVLRLQDGDRTAFEALVARTQRSAYRLGYSVAQDHHLCQDAVQDAYISVLQNIRQLRDPSAFTTWFTRIVINRCKKLLKQKRPQSLTEVVEQGKGPSTDGLEEKTGRRLQLKKALLRLTDTDRTMLGLREVQGYSYEEIAEILDIPLGTVKSRVANARRRLIQAYDV
jgi:RNA polymerase sigma-70 factor (ECF subfamily)